MLWRSGRGKNLGDRAGLVIRLKTGVEGNQAGEDNKKTGGKTEQNRA